MIIVNLVKHWVSVWGIYWVFWGIISLIGTALSGVAVEYYIIPIGILIIGIVSIYYGKDWMKNEM